MKQASAQRFARSMRAFFVSALAALAASTALLAADLRVLKTGLGAGKVTGTGINCGTGTSCATGCTDCSETGLASTASVTLSVTVDSGSEFTGWGGDCSTVTVTPPATPSCTVVMSSLRSVRADFRLLTPIPPLTDFTPTGIRAYFAANPTVDTPAEFVAALPQEFKENWILMPRSESLQTGTAELPRILLPSADATRVFTLGLTASHDSYPGAHPNAVEYMQWDATQKNFRFHEIVLAPVPELGDVIDPGPPPVRRFPPRCTTPGDATCFAEDDPKCFACHSTRNVKHSGATPGTTGVPPGLVKFKSKPNWDTYDSWGGMLSFNRDRIYQGSVEAAAFRKIFNLWTWQGDDSVRSVIEQLALQPAGVPATHQITRISGTGADDGRIRFGFDPAAPAAPVTTEPQPSGTPVAGLTAYEFNGAAGTGTASSVTRDGSFLTLHHSTQPLDDEGRGVELFDRLTAGPNAQRILDELTPIPPATHLYATGSVPIDVRPIALAIADRCIRVSGGTDIAASQTVTTTSASSATSAAVLAFLNARHGLASFNEVYDDTRRRAWSLARRKADIQKTNLDRTIELYAYDSNPFVPPPPPPIIDGLVQEHGAATSGIAGGSGGLDVSLPRIRQEVFRRSIGTFQPDHTVMGGIYVDREHDGDPTEGDNTAPVALYRYYLEPFGVSVDKWSMGVRGRSRTYTFADVFNAYTGALSSGLKASLGLAPTAACSVILPLVDAELASERRPDADAVPTFTDIQRILNKACIECHGGLGYPPYHSYGTVLDFSENEDPDPAAPHPLNRRLGRSYDRVIRNTSMPIGPAGTDVTNSYLYQRITDDGLLAHPYNPDQPYDLGNPDNPASPDIADERCPIGLMPCEGPPLSKVDIETIRRWIIGSRPYTEGDPHIRTVDGVNYDFQAIGEFVMLRDESMELQARLTAVTTAGPLGPNGHTGLTSCVSVNTAVAMRVGGHRVTYQPEIQVDFGEEFVAARPVGQEGGRLVLRVDGKPVTLGAEALPLPFGGRIARTGVAEGIEVHFPGGTSVVVTPGWWDRHRIWYMNINLRHSRAVEGVMGAIAPGNWLPALPNGDLLGPRPAGLAQRYDDLYRIFGEAWKVTDATSLFDYEPGLSPGSFVVTDWPGESSPTCNAPPQPGGPAPAPPAAPIARADAERICSVILDPERLINCVADVMTTGEPAFAETYEATERLERRVVPSPPILDRPANNSVLSAGGVDFAWSPAPGWEDADVTYRHCVWNSDELFDFNNCLVLEGPTTRLRIAYVCIALLIALLLLLLVAKLEHRRVIGVLAALALLVLIGLAVKWKRAGVPLEASVARVDSGRVYFWKVVVEDDQGLAVESPTRRFEVK